MSVRPEPGGKDETWTLLCGGPRWGNSDRSAGWSALRPHARKPPSGPPTSTCPFATPLDYSCLSRPSTHRPCSALSSLAFRRQIVRLRSSSPNTSPSSNKASPLGNSSICTGPDGMAMDRCGAAPMALSNMSVTSETVSICSREPRWRTTACASAMNSQITLRWRHDMHYAPHGSTTHVDLP